MRSRLGRKHAAWDSLSGPEWLSFVGHWSPPTGNAHERPRGPWETWQEYLEHWIEVRDVALAEWRSLVPLSPEPYAELVLREHGPEGPPEGVRPTRANLRAAP